MIADVTMDYINADAMAGARYGRGIPISWNSRGWQTL